MNSYWVEYICDKVMWHKEAIEEIRDGLNKVLENWIEEEEDEEV